MHDLTHFAVETELDVLEGFSGLIASGWEIRDFGPPWPHGPLPASAALVELVVGLLDSERASRTLWNAVEFNQHIENHRDSRGLEMTVAVTEVQLRRFRRRRSELIARWSALAPGERLNLDFGLIPRK